MKKFISINFKNAVFALILGLTLSSCTEDLPATNADGTPHVGNYNNNYTWKNKDFGEKVLDTLYKLDLAKLNISDFTKADKSHYTLKGCPAELAKMIDNLYDQSSGNIASSIIIIHKNVGTNTQSFMINETKPSLSRNDSVNIYNKIKAEKDEEKKKEDLKTPSKVVVEKKEKKKRT